MSKSENKQNRVQLGTDKRSVLGERQHSILITLYQYRFGSCQLLAESLAMTPRNVAARLTVLCNHGLVARRYTSHMKLQGKPAAYYLTARGLRVLQQIDDEPRVTAQLIKASYRDAQVSQSFVDHILAVYQWTHQLQQCHPALRVFLPREMAHYHYFPQKLPDAFGSLKTASETRRFFLDILAANTPRAAITKTIAQYLSYFRHGDWAVAGQPLPALLFVVASNREQRHLQRTIRAVGQRIDCNTAVQIAITHQALTQENQAPLWIPLDESERSYSLEELWRQCPCVIPTTLVPRADTLSNLLHANTAQYKSNSSVQLSSGAQQIKNVRRSAYSYSRSSRCTTNRLLLAPRHPSSSVIYPTHSKITHILAATPSRIGHSHTACSFLAWLSSFP